MKYNDHRRVRFPLWLCLLLLGVAGVIALGLGFALGFDTTATRDVVITTTTTAVPPTTAPPLVCGLENYNFANETLDGWNVIAPGIDRITPLPALSTPTAQPSCFVSGDSCAMTGVFDTVFSCTQTIGNAIFQQSFEMPSSCATTMEFRYDVGSNDFNAVRNQISVRIADGPTVVTQLLFFQSLPGILGPLTYTCNACDTSCGGVDLTPFFGQTLTIQFELIGVNTACTGLRVDNVCIQ